MNKFIQFLLELHCTMEGHAYIGTRKCKRCGRKKSKNGNR